MNTVDLEARYIVRCVRGTLRDKMQRIKTGASQYNLQDLAIRLHAIIPPSYSFRIVHAQTRETVGWLVGEQGCPDDPLASYSSVQLSSGESYDFVQEHHPDFKVGAFPPQATLGVTTIRHCGAAMGECRVIALGTTLGTRYESEWKLILNGKEFGTVTRPAWDAWGDLRIIRPDGSALPLAVTRQVSLDDPFSLLWALLRHLFRHAKHRPNRDTIIPPGAGSNLGREELAFYFAASLLFHAYAGLSECHRIDV